MSVLACFCCAFHVSHSTLIRLGKAEPSRGKLNFFVGFFFVFFEFCVQRFWAFFAVFATVSDTGLGGNTDRHDDVLYLCFIIVIF